MTDTPYQCQTIGLASLHLGDSRRLSPPLSNNYCIITDPVWPNAPDGMFDVDDPPALLNQVLNQFIGAKRLVIVLRADSDPRFLKAVPDNFSFFRVSTLEYVSPGYIGRKLGGLELAYQFGKPIPSKPGQRVIPGIGPKVQPGGCWKGHPCARNIDHMRWLVRWCSNEGETVIDPFMGSGTVGVAAVEQGRHFIGGEINPQYFNDAVLRVKEAQYQMKFQGVPL